MRTKKVLMTSWIVIGLLLLLAVGLSQAQGPLSETAAERPTGVDAVAASSNYIPIQGRLTDDGGNPLDGDYSLTFSLYQAIAGGTALCSDTQTVSVDSGLFSTYMRMADCDALDGRQLYLGVQVEDDPEMAPRQAIDNVPYAWSLRPGALISDTRTGTVLEARNGGSGIGITARSDTGSALWAQNWSSENAAVYGFNYDGEGISGGSGSSAGVKGGGVVGVEGTGTNIGVEATSDTGYALWAQNDSSENAAIWGFNYDGEGISGVSGSSAGVKGGGVVGVEGNGTDVDFSATGTGVIQSVAKSYVWVSGNDLKKRLPSDTTQFECDFYGGLLVTRGADSGTKDVMLPVTLPGQLYGQDVTVTGIDVYFESETDFDGIGLVTVRRQSGAGSGDLIIQDDTDRVCETACSFHLDFTENNVLDNQHGIVYVAFQLFFSGSDTYVQIGGVRLTLEHD